MSSNTVSAEARRAARRLEKQLRETGIPTADVMPRESERPDAERLIVRGAAGWQRERIRRFHGYRVVWRD